VELVLLACLPDSRLVDSTCQRFDMEHKSREIGDLLHDAAEIHHIVYKVADGEDPDWATWYSDWLVNHSNLAGLTRT